MKSCALLLLAMSLGMVSLNVFPAPDESNKATPNAGKSTDNKQTPEVTPETWRSFSALFDVINQSRQDLAELRTKLGKAQTDTEREAILKNIALTESNIQSLQSAWEMWATGGVDMDLFLPKKEEKFDWREEVQSIFEPIVVELQRLTERSRKIERLRTEQAFYLQQLDAANSALRNIDEYKAKAPSKTLQGAFTDLESSWRKRHDGIQSRLTVINLQLKELQSSSRLIDTKTGETLKKLLSGSLVNLLLALLAASLTYFVLRMINRLYIRLITRTGQQRPFVARVAHLSFILLSFILALLAAVAVLYLRGDRILMGLLLIALVGAALTLQRTLPAYMKEAKVLLNIGPVREGQRIIYNSLPWEVQAINVYSTLVNPELCGGKVLLPLRTLTEMHSRPFDEKEPWFPTQENDYVLLNDQTYGRVVLQTPELVQLRVLEADRTYPVEGFLNSNPQNLSRHGFAILLKFGVDYQHQALVTGEIRQTLENYLQNHLKQSRVGEHLQELFVEFDEAAASSLNFAIYVSFSGEAARDYFRIRRTLQSLTVDACNANGWVIPFTQMTVHLAKEG